MKHWKTFFAFLLLTAGLTLSAGQLAVRMDIQADKGILTPVSGKLNYPIWLKKDRMSNLIYNSREKTEEWKTHSFTFLSSQSGTVTLTLRGPYASGEAPQWVLYRNIR